MTNSTNVSNFTREIKDFSGFEHSWGNDGFLKRVDANLVKCGKALLTFRNDEASVYYNGNRLCNLAPQNFEPKINDLFLPFTRSKRINGQKQVEYMTEAEWKTSVGLAALKYSFDEVFPEILSNITFHQTDESFQVTGLYPYSPMNISNTSSIILLDIEAAFSATGQDTDRIDVVLYHTEERRLIFVEVKGLWDDRLKSKKGNDPAIITQMENYQKRINHEKNNIRVQYNRVIDYYNALSGRNIPYIGEETPLLGLLLVGFKANNKDSQKRKDVKTMLRKANIKYKDIGDTSNVTEKTLLDLYEKFKK